MFGIRNILSANTAQELLKYRPASELRAWCGGRGGRGGVVLGDLGCEPDGRVVLGGVPTYTKRQGARELHDCIGHQPRRSDAPTGSFAVKFLKANADGLAHPTTSRALAVDQKAW